MSVALEDMEELLRERDALVRERDRLAAKLEVVERAGFKVCPDRGTVERRGQIWTALACQRRLGVVESR